MFSLYVEVEFTGKPNMRYFEREWKRIKTGRKKFEKKIKVFGDEIKVFVYPERDSSNRISVFYMAGGSGEGDCRGLTHFVDHLLGNNLAHVFEPTKYDVSTGVDHFTTSLLIPIPDLATRDYMISKIDEMFRMNEKSFETEKLRILSELKRHSKEKWLFKATGFCHMLGEAEFVKEVSIEDIRSRFGTIRRNFFAARVRGANSVRIGKRLLKILEKEVQYGEEKLKHSKTQKSYGIYIESSNSAEITAPFEKLSVFDSEILQESILRYLIPKNYLMDIVKRIYSFVITLWFTPPWRKGKKLAKDVILVSVSGDMENLKEGLSNLLEAMEEKTAKIELSSIYISALDFYSKLPSRIYAEYEVERGVYDPEILNFYELDMHRLAEIARERFLKLTENLEKFLRKLDREKIKVREF